MPHQAVAIARAETEFFPLPSTPLLLSRLLLPSRFLMTRLLVARRWSVPLLQATTNLRASFPPIGKPSPWKSRRPTSRNPTRVQEETREICLNSQIHTLVKNVQGASVYAHLLLLCPDALRLDPGLSSRGNSNGDTGRVLRYLTVGFGQLINRLALQLAPQFTLFGPRADRWLFFSFLERGLLSLNVREGLIDASATIITSFISTTITTSFYGGCFIDTRRYG